MPTLDLFQECIALPLLATYGLRKNHTRLLCLFPEISVCVMFHMLVTILVQYFSSWIVVTVYFICFFSMLPGFHRRNNSLLCAVVTWCISVPVFSSCTKSSNFYWCLSFKIVVSKLYQGWKLLC